MSARCVSIVVADRHPVFLSGLLTILRSQSDFNVLASCCDSATCMQAVQGFVPELALIDIGLDGFRVLAAVKTAHAPTRVVFVSEFCERSEVTRAIAAGAYGMIARHGSPDSLLRDLRKVTFGVRLLPPVSPRTDTSDQAATLTGREREIMGLVCAGLSNKEVGRQLNLADGTIKVHLHHIYEKLAIRNRMALAALTRDDEKENGEKEKEETGG